MTTKRYFYRATIERVIDGDSFEAMIDLGLETYQKHKLRLKDVDTPETYRPGSDLEKQAGNLVSEHVKGLIEGKTVYLKTYADSKYGDYLAEIYLEETSVMSVNDYLLQQEFGRFYDGSKKPEWDEVFLESIVANLTAIR
jgi:micrococcal nuclease